MLVCWSQFDSLSNSSHKCTPSLLFSSLSFLFARFVCCWSVPVEHTNKPTDDTHIQSNKTERLRENNTTGRVVLCGEHTRATAAQRGESVGSSRHPRELANPHQSRRRSERNTKWAKNCRTRVGDGCDVIRVDGSFLALSFELALYGEFATPLVEVEGFHSTTDDLK